MSLIAFLMTSSHNEMNSPDDISITVYSEFESIPISNTSWNELVSNNETNTIFQTYEWVRTWWSIFSESYQLYFMVLNQRNKLIGFAPLASNEQKELVFLGETNSDYLDFVITQNKRQCLKLIFDEIKNNNELSSVRLINIPAQSSTLEHLRSMESKIYRCIVRDRISCPALVLKDNLPSIDDLINKYSIKRPYNYFNKKGKLIFRHFFSEKEIHNNLPIFFEQHRKRWSKKNNGSLFEHKKNRDFYNLIASKALEKKWLLFSVIELDNHPIAFHFGFHYNSKLIWYKPSFDVKYSKHSPGLLLLRFLFQHAVEKNLDEVDFTVGDESFKLRFTNTLRYNVNVTIFFKYHKYIIGLIKNHASLTIKKLIALLTRHE